MPKQVARYAATFGLSGGYMPDSHDGAHEFTSRRELAEFIRSELAQYDLPKSLFADVGLRRLWRIIQRHGSSCAHFSLHHGDNALEFYGLTEDEYRAEVDDE